MYICEKVGYFVMVCFNETENSARLPIQYEMTKEKPSQSTSLADEAPGPGVVVRRLVSPGYRGWLGLGQ
jgi:hypothetical protein